VLRPLAICAVLAGLGTAAAAEQREPCAIVVAIDTARFADTLAGIKTGVGELVTALRPEDQVAVVAYDAKAQVIASLMPASNPKAIAAQVAKIRPGRDGVGNVVAGLEAARTIARGSQYFCRRVVVVSGTTEIDGVAKLADQMKTEKITVSGVGARSMNRVALQTIATAGGGRIYMLDETTGFAQVGREEIKAKVVLDRLGIVFVMDRSMSMTGVQIEQAKESVRIAVELIHPNDHVGVVAFDSEATTFVRLQRAANRMRISTEISRLTTGGFSNAVGGLVLAEQELAAIEHVEPHVVLVTDVLHNEAKVIAQVKLLASHGITVSVMGVKNADRDQLARVAAAGNGQLLMLEDQNTVRDLLRLFGTPR
jgi:secreted protein with Ig-like and vWFA domain